jgi:MYXO-CTERM domain-containing protein
MIKANAWAAAVVSAILSSSPPGLAAEYFIAPDGNDSASGTSESEPWATLSALSRVGSGDTVNFEAGGTWTANGGITVSNATYQAYGTGPAPWIDGVNVTFAAVQLMNSAVLDGFTVTADNVFGVYLMGDNSILRNCEIDGTNSGMQMAVGNMGSDNVITGNYAHDLTASTGDTGNVNSSGGAEAFVVFGGSNVEVSFNSAVRCAGANQTLGGEEGGCFEIINPNGGTTIEEVRFHHNYCEESVGLFEAVTGSGTGQENPADNPGTILNISVSYNLSVDSKWLYLLQILNTHLRNVVFEHNTIVHGPRNEEIWTSGSGYNSIGLFFYEDTLSGSSVPPVVNPTDLIVRDNIFVEPYNSFAIFNGTGFAHNNNMFVPSSIRLGDIEPGDDDFFADDAGLTADYRLAAGSEAIDRASGSSYSEDIDHNPVPCGAAADIGASEYCESGAGGSSGTGGGSGAGGSVGTGGDTSAGGAVGAGGDTGAGGSVGTGGDTSAGGAVGAGGDMGAGGSVGTGGETAAGGAVGIGGDVGAGGSVGIGGETGTGLSTSSVGGAASGGVSSGTGGSGPSASESGSMAATGGLGTPNGSLEAGAGMVLAVGDSAGDQPGCACTTVGHTSRSGFGAFALMALAATALGSRRSRLRTAVK